MFPLEVCPQRGRSPIRVALGLLLLPLLSCDDSSGSSPSSAAPVRSLSSSQVKARQVNNFLINYGPWDAASIAIAKNYDIVVVHPSQGLTREIVQQIQLGNNP